MPFTKDTAREAGKRSKRGKDANVTTIRNLYAEFLDNNTDKIQTLFDRVAQEDAAKALDILFKFSSYVLPKPTMMDEQIALKDHDFNNMSDEEFKAKLEQANKVIQASEW